MLRHQMETRSTTKKRKLDDLNCDPFRRLCDVHDLIYQHLNGREVKNASLVSPEWNKNIGNSAICMKRLKLNFFAVSSKKSSLATVKSILRSQRKYSSITFGCKINKNEAKILTKFAGSLVELKLQEVDPDTPFEVAVFPKLKVLNLCHSFSGDEFIKILASRETKLEELSIYCKFTNAIIELLESQQENLKELKIWCYRDNVVQRKIEVLSQLKLRKLTCLGNDFGSMSHDFVESARKLIVLSSNTLEDLIFYSVSVDILRSLLSLPKLKNLKIYCWSRVIVGTEPLPTSTSIETLQLLNIRLTDEDLQMLLKTVPNLKSLFLRHLSIGNLKIIAETSLNLNSLPCYTSDFRIARSYEELMNVEGQLNRNIKLSIRFPLFP